jgi:hypothetical protein
MEKLNYEPFNDGYGIVGYFWNCDCGRVMKFVSGGEVCECGFVIPEEPDPDDWYEEQLKKPIEERDWNK